MTLETKTKLLRAWGLVVVNVLLGMAAVYLAVVSMRG